MTEEIKDEPKVNIEGVEYLVSDLTSDQVILVNQVARLDKNIKDVRQAMKDLRAAELTREASFALLMSSLNEKEVTKE